MGKQNWANRENYGLQKFKERKTIFSRHKMRDSKYEIVRFIIEGKSLARDQYEDATISSNKTSVVVVSVIKRRRRRKYLVVNVHGIRCNITIIGENRKNFNISSSWSTIFQFWLIW